MINYIPGFIPNKFVIFGCGGTGSRLVPLLAQFISSLTFLEETKPEIFINDFDIVEDKNLKRQNFVARDVMKNKAEVLAARYSAAFGLPIFACADRLTPQAVNDRSHPIMSRLMELNFVNTVFIMCVDSPAARREILLSLITAQDAMKRKLLVEDNNAVLQPINNVIVIDTGNENDFGQVVVSNLVHHEDSYFAVKDLEGVPNNLPFDTMLPHIPLDWKYYLGMQATEAPSCADLDQTMAINCQMAINAFSIIQNILYRKEIPFHRLDISLAHGSIPQYINPGHMRNLMTTGELDKFKLSEDPTVSAMANAFTSKIAKYKVEMISEGIRDGYDNFTEKMNKLNKDKELAEKAVAAAKEMEKIKALKAQVRAELELEMKAEAKAKEEEAKPAEASAKAEKPAEEAVKLTKEQQKAVDAVKASLKAGTKKPTKKAKPKVEVASEEEKAAAVAAAIAKLAAANPTIPSIPG